MGLLSLFQSDDPEERVYEAHHLEADLKPGTSNLPGTLLDIRPYRDNDGIRAGANLLQTLHDVYIKEGENVSDAHSFEVWFDKGMFRFRMYARNDRAKERFERRVKNVYSNSEVSEMENAPALPELEEGYYVSGVELEEQRHTFLPIRHHEADGFPHGDPYSDILGEMATLDDSIVVLQVVFKPARQDWTDNGPDGRSVEDVANDLRSPEVESLTSLSAWNPLHELEEYEPTPEDRKAAKTVLNQKGEQGFHVDIRILTASKSEREAVERARGVGTLFSKVYSNNAEQRLVDQPITGTKEDALSFYQSALEREWQDMEMILSIDELAGIAHIPSKQEDYDDDGIDIPGIPWRTTQTGSSVSATAAKDPDEGPEEVQAIREQLQSSDRTQLPKEEGNNRRAKSTTPSTVSTSSTSEESRAEEDQPPQRDASQSITEAPAEEAQPGTTDSTHSNDNPKSGGESDEEQDEPPLGRQLVNTPVDPEVFIERRTPDEAAAVTLNKQAIDLFLTLHSDEFSQNMSTVIVAAALEELVAMNPDDPNDGEIHGAVEDAMLARLRDGGYAPDAKPIQLDNARIETETYTWAE